MAHGKQRVDLHQEIKQTLHAKERFGQSKYAAKQNGTAKDGIYSYKTATAYNRECQAFATYVREHSPEGRYTSLEDARSYAGDYIQEHNKNPEISPYTVKLQASALGKLFGCNTREFGPTEDRARRDITRSRGLNDRVISERTGKEIKNPNASHFSEARNKDIVEFCRSTGLRRSELENLRGDQLRERDGVYNLEVTGKGGKTREVPIIGDVEKVVERCQEAGREKVWERVPSHMDVHKYRSQYATTLYKSLERDLTTLERNQKYYCRGDLKGVTYDKKAMLETSQALGHNRINVIAEHYLR